MLRISIIINIHVRACMSVRYVYYQEFMHGQGNQI